MRFAFAFLFALLPIQLLAAEPAPAPLFDDNGAQLTIAQFVEKYIPQDMPEGLGRKEVQAALEDAGANWVELAQPLTSWQMDYHSYTRPNLVWLIVNSPHLDRLEIDGDLLEDNHFFATISGHRHGYSMTSDLYRRYLLNYRFDDEPVTCWRKPMMDFMPEPDDRMLSQNRHLRFGVGEIVAKYAQGFTIIDRGYFGNLSDPVSLLHSRAGSKRELSILVAAALRSQGYATRFVRENRSGESWVEVYSGDPKDYDVQAWTPVYPTAPDKTGDVGYATELCGGRICVVTAGDAFGREQVTGRYTETGTMLPVFYRTDPSIGEPGEDADFSGWAITAWNETTGAYVPLDDLEFPSSDKDYSLDESGGNTPQTYTLGPGKYRLECGVRYPGGITHVQTQEFGITPNRTVTLAAYLDPPLDLPQTALVERRIDEERWALIDNPERMVFLVRDAGEPSIRSAELLERYADPNDGARYAELDFSDPEDKKYAQELLRVEDADTLPVVIVIVDGRTTLYLRGYNLNVAQWVEGALGS